MADEILIKYKSDVSELVADHKNVQATLKETEKTGVEGSKKIEDSVKKVSTATESLVQQYRKLKKEQQLATDPKEVIRLSRAVGALKDQIDDAADAAKVFASESKFEQVGNAIGSIGSKLRNLDFKGAADQSKLLVSVIQSLSFQEVISGAKDLGTTLLNVGKALFANPLFILAGVLTGIGVAAYNVVNAMRLVDVQTKTVTEAIDAQAKAVRAFSDRVAEAYISIGQALGKYTKQQADLKKQEIKNSQERLSVQQQYSADLVKLATETEVDLSKIEKGRLSESYTGNFEDLQNRKRFNLEKIKLDKLYKEQFTALNIAQFTEQKNIEIQANIDRANKSKEDAQKSRDQLSAAQKQNEADYKAHLERLAELDKVLRDLRTGNILEEDERKKQQLINQFNDESAKYEDQNEIIKELRIKLNRDLEQIEIDRAKINAKILADSADEAIKIFKESAKEIQVEDTKLARFRGKNQQDITKEQEQEERRRRDIVQQSIQLTRDLISTAGQISIDNSNRVIQNLEKNADAENSLNQDRFDKGIISKEEFENQKLAIEKRTIAAQNREKKKQFDINKNIATIQVLISTAQAIAKTASELGYPAAIPFIAIAAATGALQLAAIRSQPEPQFAKGVVDLKGEGTGTSDSISAKLSRGESVITAEQTSIHKDLLLSMNKGLAGKYIQSVYIAPALKAQREKFRSDKNRSFADNIAKAIILNSEKFQDSNILEALKISRKNDKEIAQYIVKNLRGKEHNPRSW